MRRLIAACTLALAGLVAVPSRADAYFWDWLDDLSGPSFHGITVELRIWCSFEDARNNVGYLNSLRQTVIKARAKYQDHDTDSASGTGIRRAYVRQAVTATERALKYINLALEGLEGNPNADASALVGEALAWHVRGEEHFAFAQKESVGAQGTAKSLPPERMSEAEAKALFTLPVGGITASLCLASPYARQSQYLSLDITWGFDVQKKGEPQYENRMVSFGASYHAVIKPYLTLGAGAGIATFSSNVTQPVQKFYVQPYIIDFKPLALRRNSQLRGPWWHLLYVRYNTITYPTGFALGSFAGQTEQFPAELIHAYGFYVDVEPVLRDWMGKW